MPLPGIRATVGGMTMYETPLININGVITGWDLDATAYVNTYVEGVLPTWELECSITESITMIGLEPVLEIEAMIYPSFSLEGLLPTFSLVGVVFNITTLDSNTPVWELEGIIGYGEFLSLDEKMPVRIANGQFGGWGIATIPIHLLTGAISYPGVSAGDVVLDLNEKICMYQGEGSITFVFTMRLNKKIPVREFTGTISVDRYLSLNEKIQMRRGDGIILVGELLSTDQKIPIYVLDCYITESISSILCTVDGQLPAFIVEDELAEDYVLEYLRP